MDSQDIKWNIRVSSNQLTNLKCWIFWKIIVVWRKFWETAAFAKKKLELLQNFSPKTLSNLLEVKKYSREILFLIERGQITPTSSNHLPNLVHF